MNLSRAFAKLSGVYAAVSAQEGIPVLHKEFWSIPCGGSGNFFKMSNWFVQYKFQTLTSIKLADFDGMVCLSNIDIPHLSLGNLYHSIIKF